MTTKDLLILISNFHRATNIDILVLGLYTMCRLNDVSYSWPVKRGLTVVSETLSTSSIYTPCKTPKPKYQQSFIGLYFVELKCSWLYIAWLKLLKWTQRAVHLKSLKIKRVLWFFLQLLFEIQYFSFYRIIQLHIEINVKTPSCKVPVIFAGLKWKLNFLDSF
jgi:hypothetical protein